MPARKTTFTFPFAVSTGGNITVTGGDEALRGKIIQVLFTAPGERIHKPEFGCGIFNLVFEPSDELVLAAAMEFTIAQALARWLRDDLVVEAVEVDAEGEMVTVQIVYRRKQDLARNAVRIQFK